MIKYMFAAYLGLYENFKVSISTIITFMGIIFIRIINGIALKTDLIFFPELNSVKIIKPIIIIGNPRSGTTFLHRFLVNNKIGVGMKLWKMIFPSLVLQRLLSPFLNIIEIINPAKHHKNEAHSTGITSVETDDPSFLFRYFDGFFVYGFFLAWAEKNYKSEFDSEFRNTDSRDFMWLNDMWSRNLISEKNDRVVAKMFSLSTRIPSFLDYFPDAKILYLIRDPLETVPSGLSLVTGVLDNKFGFWKIDKEKQTFYIERLYSAFLELSLKFYQDYKNNKIPENKIKIIRYDLLMDNFENIMYDILDYTETAISESLRLEIIKTAEIQLNYKSSHKYNLEKFGLTKERILKDYQMIYQEFFN